MNTKRKLVVSGLTAIILSIFSYRSQATNNDTVLQRPERQDEPVVTGQLIQGQRSDAELTKHLRRYDLIRMDPTSVVAQVRRRGRLLLKSSQRDFDLEMVPHDMRSPDYSAHVVDSAGVRHPLPETEVSTYKGKVKDLPDAQVRMSLTASGIEGAIITKERHYFLQPARSISREARADDFILYDSSDLKNEDLTCGVTLADEVAAHEQVTQIKSTDVVEAEANAPVPTLSMLKIARISTDADGEYVAAFGGPSQANTQIMNILNLVDGIYQVEIGLTFQIVQQNTWADANTDPYTTTASDALLTEFQNHWNVNFPNSGQNARSIAHLFTGKNLDGSTIGFARISAACRAPNAAYGLSQRIPTTSTSITAQTVILTAHEIAHNFGAAHTDVPSTETPADLKRSCINTIMEANIGTGSAFCPFSRSQISGHASAFSSCLVDTATPPPTSEDCVATPVFPGVINGSLGPSDCRSPSRGVDFFADRYTFEATMGQQVFISMSAIPFGSFAGYVYFIGPDGYVIDQGDPGFGPVAEISRPTNSGYFTLPQTGRYTIEATSLNRGQAGDYQLTLISSSCVFTATTSAQHFPAAGGNATLNVTVSGTFDCSSYSVGADPATMGSGWISMAEGGGVGSRTFNFNVSANNSTAGRRSFILVGHGGANSEIGGLRIPITQSGTAPDCSSTAISFGQTLNGELGAGDCHSPVRGSGMLADRFTFNAAAGQKVTIQTSAALGNPDTFLVLLGPNGSVLLTDDDSGGGTNSRIPGGNRSLTLGLPGVYTIEVSGFLPSDVGPYSLTLSADSAVNTVQLAQSSFTVNEGPLSLAVTVNRSGDTSLPASVDYVTSDTAGSNPCSSNTGAASSRCDYLRSTGILEFAGGETSKTISIPIVDDVFSEGAESFTITLTNVSGATLGTSTATLTINDNDASTGTNPVGDAGFFVRQNYIDFLNREPDTSGFNFWVTEITSCGGNTSCIEVKRVNVSAAFFLSIEFQETGYLVYRSYKSAFGNLPGAPVPVTFDDFLRDTQRIAQRVQVNVGAWRSQLEANKQAFSLAFVQRANFLAAFPNSMTAADYVAQLNTRAGEVLSASEQTNLINILGTAPSDVTKRAQVLRAVSEDQDLKNAEFNKAFVLMQYFGYLRRNPNDAPDVDFTGFDFWLMKLNDFNGNFVNAEMVKAFITSIEYRQRFGP